MYNAILRITQGKGLPEFLRFGFDPRLPDCHQYSCQDVGVWCVELGIGMVML